MREIPGKIAENIEQIKKITTWYLNLKFSYAQPYEALK